MFYNGKQTIPTHTWLKVTFDAENLNFYNILGNVDSKITATRTK